MATKRKDKKVNKAAKSRKKMPRKMLGNKRKSLKNKTLRRKRMNRRAGMEGIRNCLQNLQNCINLPEMRTQQTDFYGNYPVPTKNEDRKKHITKNDDELQKQLKLYGYKMVKIRGDGHCQFRAIADQLALNKIDIISHNREEKHKTLRINVWSWLDTHKTKRTKITGQTIMELSGYTDLEEWNNNVQNFKSDTGSYDSWGKEETLWAIADIYNVAIHIIPEYGFMYSVASPFLNPEDYNEIEAHLVLGYYPDKPGRQDGHYTSTIPLNQIISGNKTIKTRSSDGAN
jgi:hypothetical protein